MRPSCCALAAISIALASACGGDDATSPPDAPPPPRIVLFLLFDGVTLHPGAIAEASTDTTPVVDADLTLPPYLDGHVNRQPRIDALVAEIRVRLAPFDVEVVTQRPAAAPYFEIVFTGDSSLLGVQTGIGGIAPFDCDRDQPTAIGFELASGPTDDTYRTRARANWVLATLGIAQRVPITRLAHDCMCWTGLGCTSSTDNVACTIGGPDTPVETDYACPGSPATIDERALLDAALGTH